MPISWLSNNFLNIFLQAQFLIDFFIKLVNLFFLFNNLSQIVQRIVFTGHKVSTRDNLGLDTFIH